MFKRLKADYAAFLIALAALAVAPAAAWGAQCSAQDFGAAVDQAGASLRAFNMENSPKLQAKLDELARKKGWTDATREDKIREFLNDEHLASLDATANDLLVKIDTLGQSPGKGPPDCAKLDGLKAAGVELLAVMKAKSAATIAKIDQALRSDTAPPPPSGPKTAALPKSKSPPAGPAPTPSTPLSGTAAPAAPPRPGQEAPVARDGEGRAPSTATTAGKDGAKPGSPAEAHLERKMAANRGVAAEAGQPPGRPSSGAPPSSSWTASSKPEPSYGRDGEAAGGRREAYLSEDRPLPGEPYSGGEGYTIEEIQEASRGFFGSVSTGLASVIEHAFGEFGRPSAYVLGKEGGGAFLAGVRYGSGDLYLRRGSVQKVYWHGPSVGYDAGLEGSRTMFLIYRLNEVDELYRSFTGISGSAYVVGGVGMTLLKGGKVIMAPIRSGLGLRLGANIGYIRFTPQPSWNPF